MNEAQAEQLQRIQSGMELIIGPLGIFIALQKIRAAVTMHSAAADATATAATWGFNSALLANPIVLIVVAIVGLIIALVALEKKFGVVTMAIEKYVDLLRWQYDLLVSTKDAFVGLAQSVGDFGEAMMNNPLGRLMELAGGR